MNLDLTPRPQAAPRGRRILAHAGIELTNVLRNGEQLLLTLVIPLGLLVVARGWLAGIVDATTFPAGVLALAIWSTGFTSLAINTGFELRYGVLERLAATPLRKADVIAGKAASVAIIAAGQLLLIGGAAIALWWRPEPTPAGTLIALLDVAFALITFASWALILASLLKAELVLAVGNLLYLVLAGAGLVVAVPSLWWLPTAALGDGLRHWTHGLAPAPLAPLLVLITWAVVSAAIARKVFRWMS